MQKIHMRGGVIFGDIVVERHVNRPRADALRYGAQTKPQHIFGKGKAEQRDHGQSRTARGDGCGFEPIDDPFAHEAGYDRPQRYDERNDADVGNVHTELGIYGRPRAAEQGIRHAKPDVGDENDNEYDRGRHKACSFPDLSVSYTITIYDWTSVS